ncbi:MAG: hypothetical protein V4521_00420 [Pseudomonadota bacterium]
MFDLAALPLPSLPISTAGIALENAGNAGEPGETAQGGGFEAMLALQSAQPFAPVPTSGPAPTRPAIVPANGNILPETAVPVSAVAASFVQTGFRNGEVTTAPEDERPDVVKAEATLPDQAMIAAILAAPQRLSPAVKAEQPETRVMRTANAAFPREVAHSAKTAEPVTSAQPHPATFAATVAIAQSATIELAPDEPPVGVSHAPETAQKSAPAMAAGAVTHPALAAPKGAHNEMAASAKPTAPTPAAPPVTDDEADAPPPIDTADDLIAPVLHRTAEAAPQPDAAPVSRASHRPERIDFATLVDTLNRAREEAEPNTVRVSVAHADFGRVSMRFEQDDTGMSVAMSSADPGFARAVTASGEAAAASTGSETPRDQNSQPQARGSGNSSGEGTRQQQQHSGRAETAERPAAQLRDTLRRDDQTAAPDGIFA